MNRLLKWLLVFSITLGIGGCTRSKIEEDNPTISITLFYIDSCMHCQAFREEAVPALEDEFGNQLEMHYVNMDFEEDKVFYDEVTEKLENYDGELYLVPFIVVDGYFAILMYNEGEEKELISDIHAALNGEELSSYFKNERWIFKEEYHA